jgi:hypothetical protein
MPDDDISSDRVTAIATAARVPLTPVDAERIAGAVAPTAARLAAAENPVISLRTAKSRGFDHLLHMVLGL